MAKVSFSHVHMYCDSLKDLAEYKKLEGKLNSFAKKVCPTGDIKVPLDVSAGRAAWLELSSEHGDPVTGKKDPAEFKVSGQDVVEQMLVGLGWRITGMCKNSETCTLAITSPEYAGVKFLATAHCQSTMEDLGSEGSAKKAKTDVSVPDHFSAQQLARFAGHQVGRQGMAVLGFTAAAGSVDLIKKKYEDLHPKLLIPDMPKVYGNVKILEVFAYYKGEVGVSPADCGTVLRFVEGADASPDVWVLPGLKKVEAAFDGITMPAFCDHWVSNVVSRVGFMTTLKDTLGFAPKVDFNAGVVAAGEAQIESTVIGNSPDVVITDEEMALHDQSQVFLPTNNALSEVGHVHFFIKEIGQGIQHVASRVKDLPTTIQRVNDYRKMTGAGLDFLQIPRSYYGTLPALALSKDAKIQMDVAEKYTAALKTASIIDASDAVSLTTTRDSVRSALPPGTDTAIIEVVMRGRYRNMYELLRDHLSEEAYLKIVRNNILVDVQGDDLLFQIFSATVLQRQAGQEAPFLEFIQRICSEKKDPATGKPKAIKAGCGGFGIRNFLTLFLSIEVSKAAKGKADADKAGKKDVAQYYSKMVDAFTGQLEEANPVLTAISDAMTAEGDALERGDAVTAAKHGAEKSRGGEQLQVISAKYRNIMKELRKAAPAGI